MPQVDYAKLAEQARKSTSGVDYAALAEKARGITPAPAPTTTAAPAPQPKGWMDRPTGPEDFPLFNMAKGAVNAVKAIPGAALEMAKDVAPYDERGNLKMPLGNTASGILEAQGKLGVQAKDAFDRGDYFRATVKGVEYLIPILGPMMSAAGDKMEQGHVAEGIGEMATNAALTFAGMRPGAPRTTTKPARVGGPSNAKDAAAVAFAKQEGVPLDAGTATGSNFIKTVQEKAGNTYGGARTAEALKEAQTEHLARVGTEQAGKAVPQATNPVAAGESVVNVLKKQIQDAHQSASTAYGKIKAAEDAEAAKIAKIPASAQAKMQASARTPLMVDVSAALNELLPLYKQLKREQQSGVPMGGGRGRTLAALEGLMDSPGYASLSTVDAALSDLKAMARGADMPELRTSGQATAAQAVAKLDAQVRATAARHGLLQDLELGRASTRQKYAVADVLDMLSGEPGQVYRQLTQSKDVGLERLKAVQRFAPQELPRIGRAFLEDMLQQATAEGGFAHTDRIWSNWQKLGGETKSRLFSKAQIQDLDNFFLLGKRINEIKNPSGTSKVAGVLDVVTGVPAWALSRMLMTPQGVKWLTDARVVSKNPSPAARSVAIANVTKAAQSAGVPLEAIPAFGEDDRRTTPPQTRTPGAPR